MLLILAFWFSLGVSVQDTAAVVADSGFKAEEPAQLEAGILSVRQSLEKLVESAKSRYPVVFTVSSVLIGLLLMFYGNKLWYPFIFLVGVASSAVLLNTGIFVTDPHPVVYAGAGLVVGSLFVLMYRLLILAAGGIIGVVTSYLVLPEPGLLVVGLSAVVMGLAFSYIARWVIMFLTAFFGSKLLVAGLAMPSAEIWVVVFTIIGTVSQFFLGEKARK